MEDTELLKQAMATIYEYRGVFPTLVGHVTAIATLEEEEYNSLCYCVEQFMETSSMVINAYSSDYNKDDEVACTLRYLTIRSIMSMVLPYSTRVLEIADAIEQRADSDDFRNINLIQLVQRIWDRFGHEGIDYFSFDNLSDVCNNNNPWLVVELGEVYYPTMIHSFKSKTEAQMFVMSSKNLNKDNIMCRF